MSDRCDNISAARTYLAEVRSRRDHQRRFCFRLLLWAADARKRAARDPIQRELFA